MSDEAFIDGMLLSDTFLEDIAAELGYRPCGVAAAKKFDTGDSPWQMGEIRYCTLPERHEGDHSWQADGGPHFGTVKPS